MNVHDGTIETYNRSASELAEYFRGIGPRTEHIDLALKLAGVGNGAGRVVEIGCGDGRDAEDIIPKVSGYIGFDPSLGMLELARQRLPLAKFAYGDSLSFPYPRDIDVVFAFASLIHSDRAVNTRLMRRLAQAIRAGGIALINVRERDDYQAEEQTDQFGTRTYYYYAESDIVAMAGEDFAVAHVDRKSIGSNTWLTMALQRM
jgi:SAM-dependent methyltransferase